MPGSNESYLADIVPIEEFTLFICTQNCPRICIENCPTLRA